MASRGKDIELLEHVGQVKPREDFYSMPVHRRGKRLNVNVI